MGGHDRSTPSICRVSRQSAIPQGFFKRLFEMSATARFKRLCALGVLNEAAIPAWCALRNTRAHGVQGSLKAIEEVVRARDAVIELLYELVFFAVGYAGPFIAYGSHNWPIKSYPDDVHPVSTDQVQTG